MGLSDNLHIIRYPLLTGMKLPPTTETKLTYNASAPPLLTFCYYTNAGGTTLNMLIPCPSGRRVTYPLINQFRNQII